MFLLAFAHFSKKSPECFVHLLNWLHAILLQGLRKKKRDIGKTNGITSMKDIELESCCINGNKSEQWGERTYEGEESIYLCAQDNPAWRKWE